MAGVLIIILAMVLVYALVLVLLNGSGPCTGKCVYEDCDCPLKDDNDIQQDKRP
jgi:hypothetical protein